VGAELFASEGVETPIPKHRGFDFDRSKTKFGGTDSALLVGGENPNVCCGSRLSVFTPIVRLDNGNVIIEIKFSDSPCCSLMQIDRTRMNKAKCPRTIDSSDQ
jgi:hypothetical protein